MPTTIREVETKDLEQLIQLYAQPDMDHGKTISLEQGKILLEKFSQYPFYKVYVALQGDVIVGAFELLIMDNLAHQGSSSGIVEDVIVSEFHQHKGIGRAMMIYAMDICKAKGCYKVSLSSNMKRENAHRFYETLGFKRHGYSFYVDLDQ